MGIAVSVRGALAPRTTRNNAHRLASAHTNADAPDASGTVTGTLVAGGSVTVARRGPPVDLETVFAVDDGDVLTFGSPEIRNNEVVTLTVPVRAGAFAYGVDGPCMRGTGSEATFTARFARTCGATHPVMVWARTSAGYAYRRSGAVHSAKAFMTSRSRPAACASIRLWSPPSIGAASSHIRSRAVFRHSTACSAAARTRARARF